MQASGSESTYPLLKCMGSPDRLYLAPFKNEKERKEGRERGRRANDLSKNTYNKIF